MWNPHGCDHLGMELRHFRAALRTVKHRRRLDIEFRDRMTAPKDWRLDMKKGVYLIVVRTGLESFPLAQLVTEFDIGR